MDFEEKKQALKNYLLELAEKDVLVAFSGGVTSTSPSARLFTFLGVCA